MREIWLAPLARRRPRNRTRPNGSGGGGDGGEHPPQSGLPGLKLRQAGKRWLRPFAVTAQKAGRMPSYPRPCCTCTMAPTPCCC